MERLRALQSWDFNWFFIGQILTMTGHWMQQIAVGWIVYQLTGSAFLLGAIGALGFFPSFVFAPVAGSLADIWDGRKILACTQILSAAQATLLAILIWRDAATVWHLVAISLCLGVVHGFDLPVRQGFVARLVVDREVLGNAIALNSITYHLARLIGPSLAGVLVAIGETSLCFFLNATVCALAAFTFFLIRARPESVQVKDFRLIDQMVEGIGYAWRILSIRGGLVMLMLASLLVFPYMALLPVFSSDVLDGDAKLLGYLSSAPAVGAVLGGFHLAGRSGGAGFGSMIVTFGIISSMLLILFAVSRLIVVSGVLLALLGAALLIWSVSINTHLQMTVDEDKRGRVMSLYTMIFTGSLPLGYLLIGFFADRIGPTVTLMIAGCTSMVGILLISHWSSLNESPGSVVRLDLPGRKPLKLLRRR